jgi:hypothetical protein
VAQSFVSSFFVAQVIKATTIADSNIPCTQTANQSAGLLSVIKNIKLAGVWDLL